jgi:hypothetical protein
MVTLEGCARGPAVDLGVVVLRGLEQLVGERVTFIAEGYQWKVCMYAIIHTFSPDIAICVCVCVCVYILPDALSHSVPACLPSYWPLLLSRHPHWWQVMDLYGNPERPQIYLTSDVEFRKR